MNGTVNTQHLHNWLARDGTHRLTFRISDQQRENIYPRHLKVCGIIYAINVEQTFIDMKLRKNIQ